MLQELDRIDENQTKVQDEIRLCEQKIAQCGEEVAAYSDMDLLREQAIQKKQVILSSKIILRNYKEE